MCRFELLANYKKIPTGNNFGSTHVNNPSNEVEIKGQKLQSWKNAREMLWHLFDSSYVYTQSGKPAEQDRGVNTSA